MAMVDSRGRVQILWQPIVDVESRRPVAYEALGRLQGAPDTGAALESSHGMTILLDRNLRRAALATVRLLPPGARLFINVADLTIQGVVAADRPMDTGPADPGVIVWELSEGRNWHLAAPGQARRLFGHYALDDVGAGHADLERLRRLRPPWVKIARTLVRGCHRDRVKQDVIQALAWLAGRLGSRVVAEGVEHEEEALCVARLGVRYAQGFWFGRPGPPEAWLRTR